MFSFGQATMRTTSQSKHNRDISKHGDKNNNDIYNFSKNMFESFKDNQNAKTRRENSEN